VTLVLWDIDLTLVDYTGLGRSWYQQVLHNLYGVSMRHLPEWSGRTERSLTIELLTAHGVEHREETVRQVFAELVRIAGDAQPAMATLGRALPGAAEALATIRARSDVVQSLVTGNLVELAGYKLSPFGLDRHVDLDVGGYGSISADRHDLVSDAIRLASAKYGTPFAGPDVVVIGDSPLDMAAGRHHGCLTVGMTTGRHTAEQLGAAGARHVLPDLSDTDRVLETLLG
jgi:phosphoglycolate phosphatase